MGPLKHRGFTLVEVLVIVVVVGVAISLVAVNLAGDARRDVTREAIRLAGALEYATALAQWRAEPIGISAEGNAYRFWRRGDDALWIALAGDDTLAPRILPEGIRVTPLRYAGAPVAADAILPLQASGRNEPYAIRLDAATAHAIVEGDPLNRVRYALARDD